MQHGSRQDRRLPGQAVVPQQPLAGDQARMQMDVQDAAARLVETEEAQDGRVVPAGDGGEQLEADLQEGLSGPVLVALGERELREVFLWPFEAAIKEAGLQSIMNAYHELDGVPCGASRRLLDTILREEWGFTGVVVSDYFTIDELARTHGVAADLDGAAILALEAGIDVELPSTKGYGEPLRAALAAGRIDEALIDRSVARLLAPRGPERQRYRREDGADE